MNSESIAVVGAGTMGAGIAQVGVEAGFRVNLIDVKEEFVSRGIQSIRGFLEKKVAKGKMTSEQCASALDRLTGHVDVKSGVRDVVMVVEAVFENIDLKHEMFKKLDECCPAEVILASNTSTLSISKIAQAAKQHPERVIGTHYFSPVPLMRLVEVVRGEATTDAIAEQTIALVRKLGKTPIVIKDVPGFVVNRLLCLLYNEAASMVEQGIATPADIDAAVKLGCNWPMGVTEIMDMAGVDVVLLALKAMYEMTGEERYKPTKLLSEMVEQKKLGKKTGEGFYSYAAK